MLPQVSGCAVMKTVYLTYSGYNCESVLQVMEHLVRGGYALMCQCMLPYGKDPIAQAHRMICESDMVVAVITEDAADCPYMARDLRWAREAERKLLIAVVGDAAVPVGLGADCRISEYPTESEMAAFMAFVSEA